MLKADTNSSINIRNRVTLEVLKDKLLSFNGYEFEPKLMKHEKIKEILIDYFDSDYVSKDGTGIVLKKTKKELKL